MPYAWIPDDTPVLETVFVDIAPDATDIATIFDYVGPPDAPAYAAVDIPFVLAR